MPELIDPELPVLGIEEREQIERSKVAGRVVQEHVLGARVGGVDAATRRARMPFVDGRIELHPRIGAGPGAVGNPVPEIPRLDGARHAALALPVAGAEEEIPGGVVLDGLHEVVREPDRVVRALPRDRQVGVAVPVGGVDRDVDAGEALRRKGNTAHDVVHRHERLLRGADRLP